MSKHCRWDSNPQGMLPKEACYVCGDPEEYKIHQNEGQYCLVYTIPRRLTRDVLACNLCWLADHKRRCNCSRHDEYVAQVAVDILDQMNIAEAIEKKMREYKAK